jgi:hypothetical protein
LNATDVENKENDQAKTELKAMIERKRRNDFVRKREFDMLRKIRREGLTGEGLAGLEGLSHLDDSEVRTHDSGARADADVKDKIDAIERMMVGESGGANRRSDALHDALDVRLVFLRHDGPSGDGHHAGHGRCIQAHHTHADGFGADAA